MTETFDAEEKERRLLAEATSWDTSSPVAADAGDVPIVDVGPYFRTPSDETLDAAASQLRHASEEVGFHQLVGHGIDAALIQAIFAAAEDFHALDLARKESIRMDRPEWPIGGSGYLPVGQRKLPRRERGNLNEAFLIKSDEDIGFSDNQWLAESALPGFRRTVERYATSIEALALRLLPVYARALDLDSDFFTPAFQHPFWRLRLTHYPPNLPAEGDDFGIAPHVDTTFFTLLLADAPGLTIFSEIRQQWIFVPFIENAFVVNSGELLKQWSNDRFLSTRHFANNTGSTSRYSIPFFFNATATYPMQCLPSCHGPGNPPKYPAVSYRESQAAVQGE